MAAYGAHRGGDRSNDGTDSELSSIPSTRDTSPGAGASGSHHHTDSYIGKALFDFKPQDAVEVELHAGDLVHIFPGLTCAQGWCVVTNRGATGLVPLSYVTRVDEDGGKGSGGRGSSGRGSSSRRHGPLLLYARDKPREELEKMTVDELQRELDTPAAQLEKVSSSTPSGNSVRARGQLRRRDDEEEESRTPTRTPADSKFGGKIGL